MPDYGRYCPVALGTEVLADRWTPLIIRELMMGSTRFNDIARCLPGLSRTLLTQRLRHLERKGVVELWPAPSGRGHEYRLTPAGKALQPVIIGLGQWAVEFLYDDLSVDDVDAITLTWWMQRQLALDELPAGRTVIELHHTRPERHTVWFVIEHGHASVCLQHPGSDPDVVIEAATPALAAVLQGTRRWADAVAAGDIAVHGPAPLVRAVPRWLLPSPFADDIARRTAMA